MSAPGVLFTKADLDDDAVGAQPRMALPCHLRIGILDCRDHPRDPRGDDLLRELIEFGAALRQGRLEFEARFSQRSSSNPRIQKIRGFRQRRRRNARRQHQHAVFDLAVLANQHHQRPLRLQADELDMLEARIGFAGQDHGRCAGKAGEPGQRLAERRFDRLRFTDGGELGLDRLPFGFGEIADLH